MGDVVLRDGVENRFSFDTTQADIGSGKRRYRPWKTPAVAMKHRQGPQVNRVGHCPDQRVADGVQKRSAVMIDDALRIAGCSRCVVQRTGVPFVGGPCPVVFRITSGDEILVFDFTQQLAAFVGDVVDVNIEGFIVQLLQVFDRL